MSFNTFCGTDPTNLATYNKVLTRFLEGGGGGGIAAVNQGANITIPNPAVPVVALANPLTAPLNLGGVDVLDTAGAMGANGTFLQSLGAGNGTAWVAGGGGGVAAVNAGVNITIPNPAVPVVALANPLTAPLNLGGVDVLDTAGAMGANGTVLSSLGAGNGTAWIAGGGGGIAAVNQGSNISIPNPAVPVVSLLSPLTTTLNLGGVNVLDTAGVMGANGTVLSSLGQGNGTAWIAAGGGGIAAVNAGTNIDIPNPAVPVVALANPLTAQLNLGTQDIIGTTSTINLINVGANASTITSGQIQTATVVAPIKDSTLTPANLVLADITQNDTLVLTDSSIQKTTGGTNLTIAHTQPLGDILMNTNAGQITMNCPLKTTSIFDNANSQGAVGQVLGCGPAGGTLEWVNQAASTVFPVAYIPYFNQLAIPSTQNTVKAVPPTADFIRGNITPTVAQLYDPAAVAAGQAVANQVLVECFINCSWDADTAAGIFSPVAPLLSQTGGAIPALGINDDQNLLFPVTMLWNLQFEVNAGPTPAPLQFGTPCLATSLIIWCPANAIILSASSPNYVNTSVYLSTRLDTTGLSSTDVITFYLDGYCGNNGSAINSNFNNEGTVSIKCSMVRN